MSDAKLSSGLTVIGLEGLGRSGTTLAIQLIGSSPTVALERRYPFESRYLTWFLRHAELLRRPGGPTATWDMNTMIWDFEAAVGPLPWSNPELHLVRNGGDDLAARCFRAVWREFSAIAARNTSADPKSVIYYTEKIESWVADVVPTLVPARIIGLVRDPRDVWLSVQAFDRRRGSFGFGRLPGQSDAEFLDVFLIRWRAFLERLSTLGTSSDRALVRYEDMVTELPTVAARLSEFLGIELSPERVREDMQHMRQHMTSPTPSESVGRWRTQLSGSLRRVFDERLGDVMRKFGYE